MGFDWLHTRYATGKFVKNLRQDMKDELIRQGHYSSGNLADSLNTQTTDKSGKVRGVIQGLARGEKLDKKQSNVAITMNQIMAWMTAKNSGDNPNKFDFNTIAEKRRIALAIFVAIEKEGVPTNNAKKFSFNGRRTGWISLPYERSLKKVDKDVIPKIIQDIEENFMRMCEELVAKNPNLKLIK